MLCTVGAAMCVGAAIALYHMLCNVTATCSGATALYIVCSLWYVIVCCALSAAGRLQALPLLCGLYACSPLPHTRFYHHYISAQCVALCRCCMRVIKPTICLSAARSN